jgi:hypothetical protein
VIAVSEEAQIKLLGIGEHHPPLAKIRRSWGPPTFGASNAPHDYLRELQGHGMDNAVGKQESGSAKCANR